MSDVKDLVGDVEPEELEQLQRVHTLLERAGPPPSLSPGLARPPAPGGRVIAFPRRHRYLAAAATAAAAALLFAIGYVVGDTDPDPFRTIPMTGAGSATATLAIYDVDASGNWPMELDVEGLANGRYALWLTRGGKLARPCGTFTVAADEASVPLNAPYRLRDFDGWVVVPVGGTRPVLTT